MSYMFRICHTLSSLSTFKGSSVTVFLYLVFHSELFSIQLEVKTTLDALASMVEIPQNQFGFCGIVDAYWLQARLNIYPIPINYR